MRLARQLLAVLFGLGIAMAFVPFCEAQPTLIDIGVPQNGAGSRGLAVNADGSVVVGVILGTEGRAFRWTAVGGIQDLGSLPGWLYSLSTAVSADGTVVVGFTQSDSSGRAFRWTATDGMEDLGVLPGASASYAYGVSGDGSAVVGSCTSPDGDRAFRWTRAEGMQSLGVLDGDHDSYGTAISGDGLVITGISDPGRRAFKWSAIGGMQILAMPPGWYSSSSTAISADGLTIVGNATSYLGTHAVKWTAANGMQDLGVLAGGSYSSAMGVSGDGTFVLGSANTATRAGSFLWTDRIGMVDPQIALPTADFDLAGWLNFGLYGVSADGSAITGVGSPPIGGVNAFLISGLLCMEAPRIVLQPAAPAITCQTRRAELSVLVGGVGPVAYRWQWVNGAGGVTELSPGDYTHIGGLWVRDPTTPMLNIFGAGSTETGGFRCVITNNCGTVTTDTVTMNFFCSADFNCDGLLNPDDLSDFISAYFDDPRDAESDFNGDGVTDDSDLSDFINAFFVGGC